MVWPTCIIIAVALVSPFALRWLFSYLEKHRYIIWLEEMDL